MLGVGVGITSRKKAKQKSQSQVVGKRASGLRGERKPSHRRKQDRHSAKCTWGNT